MSIVRTTPLKTWPSAANSTSIAAPAVVGGLGAWCQIIASAANDSQIAGFVAELNQLAANLVEIQIGVGSAGNEVSFGSFLVVSSGNGNLSMETLMLPVPVNKIKAGDRVSARIAQQSTSTAINLAILYYENLDSEISTEGAYNYLPLNTNSSIGVLTPSTTPWQDSDTWFELASALGANSAVIGIGVLPGSGQAGEEWELDLAIGIPGSEQVVTTISSIVSDAVVQGFQNRWLPTPFPVNAHARISCKIRKSGSSSSSIAVRLLFIGSIDLLQDEEETVFVNDRTPGITHIEITKTDNSVEAWSVIPQDDPLTYDHGRKPAVVLAYNDIRRSSSDFYGVPIAADFKFTVRDKTLRILGYLGNVANTFINRPTVTKSIGDIERRQQVKRRTIFRGPVRNIAPRSGDTASHEFTIKDYLQERFGPNSDIKSLPRRKVLKEDFPNCEVTLVNSSAEGYVVNGAFGLTQVIDGNTVDTTVIAVHNGIGTFSNDQIKFSGHATIYSISKSSVGDPETSITLSSKLTATLSDGETITQTPSHQVTAARGNVVPVRAGLITDKNTSTGPDSGDGQGKSIYVGDQSFTDGHKYAIFLWACHGCYSPNGKPIQQLYFWNQSVDNLSGATLYENGIPMGITFTNLTTEAGSGGRLLVPGYTNWSDNGISESHYNNAGRRYTMYGLRGIYRDWALGIRSTPQNLGGVNHSVNAYGMDSSLDGHGTEVRDIHDQFVLWFNNFGCGDYQGGSPLPNPVFPDDASLTILDLASIAAAKAHGTTLVSGGFRGDWSLGVDNEQITMADAIKAFNLSMGVEQSWNRKTQYFVNRLDMNQSTSMTGAKTLTDERDISKGSFGIDEAPTELFTGLPFTHTKDELGREPSGWRSSTADFNVASRADIFADNADIVQKYSPSGTELLSQPLQFRFLRGKNRSTDASEYQQGSDTINAILRYKLTLSKVRYFTFITWGVGYDIEMYDRLWIRHFANVDSNIIFNSRRSPRPIRVIEHSAKPDKWKVALRCFDLGEIFSSPLGDPAHGPFDLPSVTITGSGGTTIGHPSTGSGEVFSGSGGTTIGHPTITGAGGLGGSITLAWDASTDPDTQGYFLEWGTASGVYTSSRDILSVLTYTLTGLTPGTTYYIVVESYISTSFSADSNEVSVVAV